VLRAVKSFGQKKYDVFEQNCKHSTRWCKTGIHDSIQMEVCFTTLGKAALIVVLRLISLLMLWLLHLSGDTQTPQGEKLRTQYAVEKPRTQYVQLYQHRKSFVACCLCRFYLLEIIQHGQHRKTEKRRMKNDRTKVICEKSVSLKRNHLTGRCKLVKLGTFTGF